MRLKKKKLSANNIAVLSSPTTWQHQFKSKAPKNNKRLKCQVFKLKFKFKLNLSYEQHFFKSDKPNLLKPDKHSWYSELHLVCNIFQNCLLETG